MLRGNIGPRLADKVTCKVAWDNYTLNFYSVDSSTYTSIPAAVAYPRNEKDIIKILKFASQNKIPVTPRGAGTGLVGSSLGRGIILDMRNFNNIKVGRGYVQAGSGVFKGELDKALKKHGRFLGPNPSIGPFCTVGGMIGTNASGSHSIKYGSTVDNLISVQIVTARGNLVSLPQKRCVARKVLRVINSETRKHFPQVSKNSCGYRIDKVISWSDVQKIVAGSEGTLGIITYATLKTNLIPRKIVLMITSYKTLKEAAYDVTKILTLGPSAVEMIDYHISQRIKTRLPLGTKCLLFVEFDDNISKKINSCRRIISGKILITTTKPEDIFKWWTHRNTALSHTLQSISKDEVIFSSMEDAAVPVKRLPLLLDLIEHLTSRYPIRVITYGHAGNGNLHTRPILKRKDKRLMRKITLEFFSGVISIGGTITGEHGDGLARSEFVKMQYGKKTYAVFKKLKRLFDPDNILNPGKIVI
ncbi:MAG: FAD-binding oxidoreductase [Thaumarchaeota archaeon]|nr:FAD-binding oxidoreductase [Nitrososphaerota archaeon]